MNHFFPCLLQLEIQEKESQKWTEPLKQLFPVDFPLCNVSWEILSIYKGRLDNKMSLYTSNNYQLITDLVSLSPHSIAPYSHNFETNTRNYSTSSTNIADISLKGKDCLFLLFFFIFNISVITPSPVKHYNNSMTLLVFLSEMAFSCLNGGSGSPVFLCDHRPRTMSNVALALAGSYFVINTH